MAYLINYNPKQCYYGTEQYPHPITEVDADGDTVYKPDVVTFKFQRGGIDLEVMLCGNGFRCLNKFLRQVMPEYDRHRKELEYQSTCSNDECSNTIWIPATSADPLGSYVDTMVYVQYWDDHPDTNDWVHLKFCRMKCALLYIQEDSRAYD